MLKQKKKKNCYLLKSEWFEGYKCDVISLILDDTCSRNIVKFNMWLSMP